MLGIYDCFGYNVPFAERYKLIKNAGFDCVMLWWSDKFGRGEGYEKDVQYAREAGLFIENIHTPVHEQNFLSCDDLSGESVFRCYLQCADDCRKYGIPVMVIHLPDDNYPLNALGIGQISEIIGRAENRNVKIAFENLANIHNLELVMNTFNSPNAGFCYDSCHHANYAADHDLLATYGDRLTALHLHDNGGKNNQHQLPFDGNICWKDVMKNITITGYSGATALEPMNWDYGDMTIEKFLEKAHSAAERLAVMRESDHILQRGNLFY